jgi:hypothetical protein
MINPRKLVLVAVLGAAVAGGTYLHAQPGAGEGEGDADITVPMEVQAEISPREMREQTDAHVTEMQGMLERVVELQQVARKQNDVIKLNCVNDKLLQVKQLLNIAEAARTNMIEAIAAQNEGDRYHQFGQVTIAHEKVSVLRDEAEACIGEELVFLGPTEVDVDKPDIVDDPTRDSLFPPFEIEEPAYATPFR